MLGKLFGCGRRQSFVQHRLCGREVFLHMRRRHREHRTNPLEALPVRLLRQPGWVGYVKIYPEQILNRVRVFLAGQHVEGHPLALGQSRCFAFLELTSNPLGHASRFLRLGSRLVFRWHLAGANSLQHICPMRGGKRC